MYGKGGTQTTRKGSRRTVKNDMDAFLKSIKLGPPNVVTDTKILPPDINGTPHNGTPPPGCTPTDLELWIQTVSEAVRPVDIPAGKYPYFFRGSFSSLCLTRWVPREVLRDNMRYLGKYCQMLCEKNSATPHDLVYLTTETTTSNATRWLTVPDKNGVQRGYIDLSESRGKVDIMWVLFLDKTACLRTPTMTDMGW